MVHQIYEFIDQIHHLIKEMEDQNEKTDSSIAEEEEENDQPGELTEEGNIDFHCKTTTTTTTEHGEQHSKYSFDSRLMYQQILKPQGYLLLDIHNSNGLYFCKKNQVKRKIMAHMNGTKAYTLIEPLTQTNPTCVQQHLDTIVKQVTLLLNDLIRSQCINDSQFRQMNVERSKVRMDYLFFLPDLRQKDVPFLPIMVCSLGPTVGIARYLSRLLQPIYDQVACPTTFFKDTDAVHAIDTYTKKGLLRSKTLFATVHIHDLCARLSHEEILRAFERFLNEYYTSEQSMPCVTIDTIMKLVRLILQNQFFLFENQVYRQIKGGATTSPLTILLMNIYMFYRQEDLVKILTKRNEIFGRCFDKIFLTWNGWHEELRSLIHTTFNKKQTSFCSPLRMTTSIGKKINYMDAQICHFNGDLRTKINHDFDTEPRALPYVYDHPRLIYSTLIRASLVRAVLCCSNVLDFHLERLDIEQIFHTNGYDWEYINEHVEQFFQEFNALELLQSDMIDQLKYKEFRRFIFNYDQQQLEMKMKQRKAEQTKERWYISSTLNGETLNDLQKSCQSLWKNYLHNHIELNNSDVEIIGHPKYPSNTK